MNREERRFTLAKQYRERAYAPYSNFLVGAAIETDKSIYGGVNVENISYGGTICAERGAVMKAISEEGAITIRAVTVVTDTPKGVPPCALCLQVLSEFATADTIVEIANIQGVVSTHRFSELLPVSFTEIPKKER